MRVNFYYYKKINYICFVVYFSSGECIDEDWDFVFEDELFISDNKEFVIVGKGVL